MNLLLWCCVRWRCVSCCICDIEMSDQVLWGVSNMVHLTELTYMLLRCLLLVAVSEGVGGVGGAVMTFLIVRSWCSLRVDTLCTVRGTWVNSLAATRLMVHVHEVTYVEIVDSLERSKPINCWTWCKRFICDRVKTRVDGLPNPQLFSQAYQYVWQKNNVDKNLFQLLATELKNGEEEIVIKKMCWRWWGAQSHANHHWTCVLGPSSWNFVAIFQLIIGVHKTLRGLKKQCTLLLFIPL